MIPQKFIILITLMWATSLGFGQAEQFPAVQYLENQLAQAKAFKKERQYDKARDCLESGIEKSRGKIPINSTLPAEAHLFLGIVYRFLGDYEKALTTLEKSHALFKKANNVSTFQWGKINNMLGLLNFEFRNLAEAQTLYEKAIDYFTQSGPQATKELGITHCNLGNLLFKDSKLNASLEHFQKGGALLIKTRASYNELTRYYNGIGIVHSLSGDLEKALDYYQKSLEASLYGQTDTPRHTAVLYSNIGSCYIKLNQIKQARLYINKAEAIYKNLFGDKHFYFARTLRQQGQIEIIDGNPELAIKLLSRGKHILKHFYKDKRRELPKINLHLIDAYLQLNQPKKALAIYEEGLASLDNKKQAVWLMKKAAILKELGQYQSALTALDIALVELNFEPKAPTKINDNFNAQRILNCLEKRGQINWTLFQEENDIPFLEAAKQDYDLAILVLENIRNSLQTESSKQFAFEKYFSLFSGAMPILHQLYQSTQQKTYIEQAFILAEKSKSLVLAEALERNKLKTKTNIPIQVLNRERQLKSQIALFEQQRIIENEQEQPNNDKLLLLNDQIFYTKNDLYALQDSIANTFFSPYQTTDKNLITLSEISTLFPHNQTALIEYFVTDTALHSFTFYQGQYYWDVTKIPYSFKNRLINYCQELADFSKTPNQENSQWLVQQLLEKQLAALPFPDLKKLIIIPDNYLGYLPFEALPSLNPSNNYLIEDFEISYAYAAHLLMQQNKVISSKARKIWGGFAPTYASSNELIAQRSGSDEENNLMGLPGAQVETRAIGDSFKGDFFIGSTVSESTFKKYASDYRILHLSMHAEIDDSHPAYSHFVFPVADKTDEQALTAAELSNLPLNAELAVLSACNTGFGSIKKGEGIMSLSRAFMYAGVPSTIMSLWKVPDVATSKLMTTFYEYLQQGVTKDAALRQAKLYYLDNTFSPEQRHPFYWTGFIATGNMNPVKTSSSLHQIIPSTLISLVLGLLGFWIFWKKRF